MDDTMFFTTYTVDSQLSDDPMKWLTKIYGEVRCYDEQDAEHLVAKVEYYYADLDGASDNGYPPEYVLDHLSQTAWYIPAFFKIGDGDFLPKALKKIGYDGFCLDLLVLDRIEILPDYRGQGLTSMLLEEAERLFAARSSVFALRCFPLQLEAAPPIEDAGWRCQLDLKAFTEASETATKSLSSYYNRLGFVDVGCDQVMARLIGG